jgi:membrane fusion protein (multidrug efflux system)
MKQKKPGKLTRFLPLFALLLLVLIVFGLGAWVREEKNRIQEEKRSGVVLERPPVNVVVQELVPVRLHDRLNLPGIVESWERLDIVAEVRGTVVELLVEKGDHVNRGDVIVRLDSRDYENSRNASRASHNLALTNLKRLQGLRVQESIAQSELDFSRAEVERLAAELALAELQLQRCSVRSAIAGTVNELLAKKGLYLAVGDPVATVLELDRVKVSVGIPETDVDAVRRVDTFTMVIGALQNRKVAGVRHFLAVAPESQAQIYRLELAAANEAQDILPGMFARVEIIKEEFPAALAIPLYAVISRDNTHFVFLEEENTAKLQEVSLGILEGWQVQITEGLAPGERVIVVGHRNVDDGQQVNVVQKIRNPAEIAR